MKNRIPDFSQWIESEADKKVAPFKDGTTLLEIRIYRNKLDDGRVQTGTAINFFGKEVLKLWNIFISDEEFVFSALMTDEGEWEISVPISKDESVDSNEKRGIIIPHIDRTIHPYIQVSIQTSKGRIERIVYKNNLPPR